MESKTITTACCRRINDKRAILEGTLSLPYEVSDLSSVLDICGYAEILNAKAEEARILVSGKARYTVMYSTKSGCLDSFDSECSFEHSIDLPEASSLMTVAANASVCGTGWRIDNGAILLRSELSIDLLTNTSLEMNIIAAEPSDEGYEFDICTAQTTSCSGKSIKAYANADLRIPQNLPEIRRVLMADGKPVLRSIRRETDRIIIEGDLCICIAYESSDKAAPLQCFTESFPFGEIIKDPSCSEDSRILAELSAERITAELSAADTVSVSCVVAVNTLCINKHDRSFIRDLYAMEGSTETTLCRVPLIHPELADSIGKTLHIGTFIPESAPEAARILFASVYPEITGILYENGRTSVDGILHIMLTYTTADAGIKSTRTKEVFEANLGNYSGISAVKALCSSITARGTGRNAELTLNMEFYLYRTEDTSLNAVNSVNHSEKSPDTAAGIVIYFADEGERLWNIRKKYTVPQTSVIPLDCADEIQHRGSRVMILR